MQENEKRTGKQMAFAMYVPRDGKGQDLLKLVENHVPTLREYGMVTDRDNYLVQSTNGTVIEIFEWKSTDAIKAAHEHPAVAAIWEKMYACCSFGKMQDLPENGQEFPDFAIIE